MHEKASFAEDDLHQGCGDSMRPCFRHEAFGKDASGCGGNSKTQTPFTMKKRLLLVDDDRNVRESIARVLLLENYRVMLASNGDEALNLVNVNPVDMVLLDLNMPKKNGWDTFVELSNQNPRLPIIIITARANQSFTSVAAGVDALMEKPLDFESLLETIRNLLVEPPELRMARRMGHPSQIRYVPSAPRNDTHNS
jgi:DNA-binding NtrC family response regulator